MPSEISLNEMKDLVLERLIEWPPFKFDGKVYAWRVATEDLDAELVWCVDP